MFRSAKKVIIQASHKQAAFLRAFGRDEAGSMVFMTLSFFVMMLILGGMAVDFMRFESRRTMLQNTADVAVLAAAELDQVRDAKAIVIDYFDKAGFGDAINGEPEVIEIAGYKRVSVEANFDLDTFFLKFAGIPQLSAPAQATAAEGMANIEVSLVVDISDSMRDPVTPANRNSPAQSKIQALREAAKSFAHALLTPAKYRNKISLSLVPYTDQVNAGPNILRAMGVPLAHNYSHCVDFNNNAFRTPAMPAGRSLRQSQHFQSNPAWDTRRGEFDGYTNGRWNGRPRIRTLDSPTCPQQSFERIIPLSQNYSQVAAAVNQLQPRGSTSIFLGVKWGAALLDPSMRPVVQSLTGGAYNAVDTAFAGRPANYPVKDEASTTRKIMVIMTDGKNDNSYRLPARAYNTAAKRTYFANTNWPYAYATDMYRGILGYRNWRWLTRLEQAYTPSQGDALFLSLCDQVKDKGVIVYAVAVEAPTQGQRALSQCASSASHFFDVQGDELETVFQSIAKQITELRLTL